MNNCILVTGGSGYIGSHTIVELLEKGFEVISVDNQSNSSISAYENIFKITGKRIMHYSIDVCEQELLEKIFKQHHFSGIIHFAAFKAVGESVEFPLKYYHNNINSLINILELSKKYNVNNLIFSSSCSVYGNIDKLPVDENTPLPNAESPYAYTKQIGEIILKDVCKTNLNFNAISLRYFNPVGAHVSGLIGESSINKPNNLVPIITATAIGKIKQLSVHGNDYPTRDGTCIRDYIHVTDIARAHVLAMDKLINYKPQINYDVINLGSGNGVSVLEMINAFEKISGEKLNYIIGPRRPGDVIAVYADNSKAKEYLNWNCEFDVYAMMKTAWKWEKNNNNPKLIKSKTNN
jgi:UDP-glucose 4-epimerase